MADRGIKKVIIPKNSLPNVTADNTYLVRYRIVSEDRNRVSGWSPVFKLAGRPANPLNPDNVIYSRNDRVISLTWLDNDARPRYDIFVKIDGGQYQYHGTATATSYTIITQGGSSFQFAIQAASISKEKKEDLEIYESQVISLV